MLNEELRFLKQTIYDFSTKEIAPKALNIEENGIDSDIIFRMVEMGFMGAVAPSEYDGSALDNAGYAVLLEEIAKNSPSLAFYLMIQNSFVIMPILKYGSEEQKRIVIHEIAKGEASGTLIYSDILDTVDDQILTIKDGKISGTKNYVMNSSGKYFILNTNEDGKNRLLLIKSGGSKGKEHAKLGFRGISFSPVSFDTTAGLSDYIGTGDGKKLLSEIIDNSAIAMSAIALGMSESVISKAIEYSKVRYAFGYPLADFQPLAFAMSETYGELNIMRNELYRIATSPLDLQDALTIKHNLIELAKKSSKLAIQIHGGYGYLEDFGIEKFYRDSMFLSVLSGNRVAELTAISNMIFGAEVAKI